MLANNDETIPMYLLFLKLVIIIIVCVRSSTKFCTTWEELMAFSILHFAWFSIFIESAPTATSNLNNGQIINFVLFSALYICLQAAQVALASMVLLFSRVKFCLCFLIMMKTLNKSTKKVKLDKKAQWFIFHKLYYHKHNLACMWTSSRCKLFSSI